MMWQENIATFKLNNISEVAFHNNLKRMKALGTLYRGLKEMQE